MAGGYEHPHDAAFDIANRIIDTEKSTLKELINYKKRFQKDLEDTVEDLYTPNEHNRTEWDIAFYHRLLQLLDTAISRERKHSEASKGDGSFGPSKPSDIQKGF